MSSSLAGPVPARTGVRSMITVTYLSPRRVWRHACSSTPMTFTPFNRPGSLISARRPSARTASCRVPRDAKPLADASDTQVLTHDLLSAQTSPRRDSLARGSAARLVSWRHTCPHPVHRYRRIVTSRVVGCQPSGSCASSRVKVSRGLPAHPQRRHQPSVPSSASRTRHARTARSGSRRWPTTTRPSSSRPQNGSGQGS
jgi:hypothetical protein